MDKATKKRWLIRGGVFLITAAAVGVGASMLSKGGPEALLRAAQAEFDQGTQSQKQNDLDAARKAYEAAEAKLVTILEKEPGHSRALVLRYKTLNQLSGLLAQDEAKQGNTAADRPSVECRREAERCFNAALADPDNAEAQGLALSMFFGRDELNQAIPYAERVVENADKTDIPHYTDYQLGARYVLAWSKLSLGRPQAADEALAHLKVSLQLESPPRWRVLGLQAQALKAKDPISPELQTLLDAGVERARRELDGVAKTVGDSPTNLRGLLDLLVLSVEQAPDARRVLERAELTVTAAEKVVSPDKGAPKDKAVTEVAKRATALSAALSKLPAARKPKAEDIATLTPRIEKLMVRTASASSTAATSGSESGAATFLELARNATRDGLIKPVEGLAQKGLEAAAAAKLPPEDAVVLGLQTEATWALVLQGKPLPDSIRKAHSFTGPKANLLEGLIAARDGSFEFAIKRLEQAQREGTSFSQSLYPTMGLAYACMASGACGRGQSHLEKLTEQIKDFGQLREAERALAELFFSDRGTLQLELFQCYLNQGKLDKAHSAYQALQSFKAQQLTAAIAFINAYADQGWDQWSAQKTQAARSAFDAADKKLLEARALAADDARLAWSEAYLLVQRAGLDQLAGDKALERAEKALAAGTSQTAKARWLIMRKKLAEADAALKDGADKVLRAQLEIAKKHTVEQADADRIVGLLESSSRWVDDPALVGAEAALTTHERLVVEGFHQAVTAQATGQFAEAARHFEMCLSFDHYQGQVRRGLLGCLLTYSLQSPKEAEALAASWARGRHRDEPVLLLAAARAAGQESLAGLEANLKSLGDLLVKKGDAGLAAYMLADEWRLAGRPDRARRELDRAAKAIAGNPQALELAGQLALADEDWNACIRYGRLLTEAQPDALEGNVWQAEALDHQGRAADAKAIYQQLVDKHPNRPEGYRGMVSIYGRSKEYAAAQPWAKRWRERCPSDPTAVRASVRLLSLEGKDASALASSEVKRAGPGLELEFTMAAAQGFFDAKVLPRAEQWALQAAVLATKAPPGLQKDSVRRSQFLLGDIYLAQGANDKAIEIYKSRWQEDPGNMIAGNNLAWLLDQKFNKAQEAYDILEKVRLGSRGQKALPGDRLPLDLLDTIGLVYNDARHFKEAAAVLEEALDRYKDEPRLYRHLGKANLGRNRPQEATQCLEKAATIAERRARGGSDSERKYWLAFANEARQEMRTPK